MDNTGSSNLCNKCHKPYYGYGSYTVPLDVCRCYEKQEPNAELKALKAENERLKANSVSVEEIMENKEMQAKIELLENQVIFLRNWIYQIAYPLAPMSAVEEKQNFDELRKKVGER
jgi:hypothetical protein